MDASLIVGLIALAGFLGLGIVFWRFHRALIKHVEKLKKTLSALDIGLQEKVEKVIPRGKIDSLESQMERLEDDLKLTNEKREADRERYENFVIGIEKRLAEATKIASGIARVAGQIGKALKGGDEETAAEEALPVEEAEEAEEPPSTEERSFDDIT